MLHDVKWYLVFLVIIMGGFSAAFHILFRQDQEEHEVCPGQMGGCKNFHLSEKRGSTSSVRNGDGPACLFLDREP